MPKNEWTDEERTRAVELFAIALRRIEHGSTDSPRKLAVRLVAAQMGRSEAAVRGVLVGLKAYRDDFMSSPLSEFVSLQSDLAEGLSELVEMQGGHVDHCCPYCQWTAQDLIDAMRPRFPQGFRVGMDEYMNDEDHVEVEVRLDRPAFDILPPLARLEISDLTKSDPDNEDCCLSLSFPMLKDSLGLSSPNPSSLDEAISHIQFAAASVSQEARAALSASGYIKEQGKGASSGCGSSAAAMLVLVSGLLLLL